jgi:hypothetical protein
MPRLHRLLLVAVTTLLPACSSSPAYNPTVFPFEIDNERLAGTTVKTVVIPHVNLGSPSRNYLEKEAPRIDAQVGAYLKEHGFTVLPQRQFEQQWNSAVRVFGNPVDPTSGKVNLTTYSRIMQSVRDELRKSSKVDAFVFTDLVEVQVAFNGGLQHLARWDGVARKPTLQGPGSGVTADFDWNMPVSAVSLGISIYDNLLENEEYLMEGIQLAFHPFIEMERWPGKP